MRVAVVCVVLAALGCSKKSETKNETKNEPKQEAKPAEDKPAEAPKPAEPAKPAEAPKPPDDKAAKPSFDCAAIVTADDFKKACNANVELTPTMFEGKGTLTLCSRSVHEPDKKGSIAQWSLSTFTDVAAAEQWFELDKATERKPISGVGDAAWTGTRELKATKSTDHEVGVRKGTAIVIVGYTQNSLNKKPPCTVEQLTEIARLVAGRLP
ncbi:MAG TPA: hypothetical protein VIV40_02600 [Kofleriaceae bacterium]